MSKTIVTVASGYKRISEYFLYTKNLTNLVVFWFI